jgi:hypothetical protein
MDSPGAVFFQKTWPLSGRRDALSPVKSAAEFLMHKGRLDFAAEQIRHRRSPRQDARSARPDKSRFHCIGGQPKKGAAHATAFFAAQTVLPNCRYPHRINDDKKPLQNSFVMPAAARADVSATLRAPAERTVARRGRAGTGVRRASVRGSIRKHVHQSS